ncbi:hypothetical protein AC1031_009717 [Aphanomyces cochlioides]|nr:hypothetical protein AC1031_009717 [Aphanomyces cochlioides]
MPRQTAEFHIYCLSLEMAQIIPARAPAHRICCEQHCSYCKRLWLFLLLYPRSAHTQDHPTYPHLNKSLCLKLLAPASGEIMLPKFNLHGLDFALRSRGQSSCPQEILTPNTPLGCPQRVSRL